MCSLHWLWLCSHRKLPRTAPLVSVIFWIILISSIWIVINRYLGRYSTGHSSECCLSKPVRSIHFKRLSPNLIWILHQQVIYHLNFPDDSIGNKILGKAQMLSLRPEMPRLIWLTLSNSLFLLLHWIYPDWSEWLWLFLLVWIFTWLLFEPIFDTTRLYRFASGHGGLSNLGVVNVSPLTVPILCGIIASVVQCFFVYRIFTLRRSYWWICIIILMVC